MAGSVERTGVPSPFRDGGGSPITGTSLKRTIQSHIGNGAFSAAATIALTGYGDAVVARFEMLTELEPKELGTLLEHAHPDDRTSALVNLNAALDETKHLEALSGYLNRGMDLNSYLQPREKVRLRLFLKQTIEELS